MSRKTCKIHLKESNKMIKKTLNKLHNAHRLKIGIKLNGILSV